MMYSNIMLKEFSQFLLRYIYSNRIIIHLASRPIDINTEATGVELHKDSKFFASWEAFKENNPVVNKFVDYRLKYEESNNPLLRGARILTDKMQDIVGGLFSRTELSEVLTEITKMDPNFCKEQFLKVIVKIKVPYCMPILSSQLIPDIQLNYCLAFRIVRKI